MTPTPATGIGLGWMAWTWQTAAFFDRHRRCCCVGMAVWEWRSPGGAPRRGVLRHRHDARRPPVHLAAGRRLRPPDLARAGRRAAVGRDAGLGGVAVLMFRYV